MKHHRNAIVWPLALLVASIAPACGGSEPTGSTNEIYVSFPPLASMAQRIVGDAVTVHCPLPEGVHPGSWAPSRDVITLFQNAPLVLVHGAELESWVGKASLPASSLVDVSAPLSGYAIEIEHPGHSHGSGGAGSHTHPDPHMWLDPTLAKKQAEVVLEAVVKRWPDVEKAARSNYAQLASDFDELDKRWKAMSFKLSAAKSYAASHSLAYLAKRYGVEFLGDLHLSATKVLSPDALEILATNIGVGGPKLLWWDTEPSADVAKALLDRFGFRSVYIDTAATMQDGDYIEVQSQNIERVEKALASL